MKAARLSPPFGFTTPIRSQTASLQAVQVGSAALDRVLCKFSILGDTLSTMSTQTYGDWLDALPREEFIELIAVIVDMPPSKVAAVVPA